MSSIQASAPLHLAALAVQLQYRVVILPWMMFIYGLSFLHTVLLRFLVLAGSPPVEYSNKAKLREALSVVDHMHIREDAYRRKIKELQEETEIQLRDKRKALVKLRKARQQLSGCTADMSDCIPEREPMSGTDISGPDVFRRPANTRTGMHISMLLATLATLWFYRHTGFPLLSRKIVSSVIFPAWIFWLWSITPRSSLRITIGLYCCSWFLMGFVFCQWATLHG